jgi:hypothetical protein
VLAAPDAKAGTGKPTNGAVGTVVVSRSQDRAALIASGMPKPPGGGRMRPAGLLDPTACSDAVLMTGPVGTASGMGITVEPSGGSAAPTSQPPALMNFPSA